MEESAKRKGRPKPVPAHHESLVEDPGQAPSAEQDRAVPQDVDNNSHLVPLGMRMASEWSWRLLVVVAALYVLVLGLTKITIIVIPLLVSLLLCGLLAPAVGKLTRWGLPRGLSVLVTLLGTIGVLTALVTLVGQQFSTGLPQLSDKAIQGFEEVREWILEGPLKLNAGDFNTYIDQFIDQLKNYSGALANTTISLGITVGHILAGTVLALFITIFFLLDGKGIWRWTVSLLPYRARPAMAEAGDKGWKALVAYVRVQLFVAFVDGLGVGLVALFLGVPLFVPLGVLVFLGSFIPIVGSLVSGLVAVLVALVANGPVTALLMLAGVILVQQFESHVLQPFVIGNSVAIHPLAIVLVVAAGSYIAGITGALFSVPLVAIVNAMVRSIADRYRDPDNPTHFVKAQPAGEAADPTFESLATSVLRRIASPAQRTVKRVAGSSRKKKEEEE